MTFLFHNKSPITFQDELPERADVVIIGGGVIGICTAWFLVERGLSVFVCDKGRVAGEQSSRNWGWIRVTGRDPDEVPIAIDSIRRWEEISAQLECDIGFRREGVLALAETDEEMSGFETWAQLASEQGLQTDLFSAENISRHIDVPTANWKGGMVTTSDARAEPFIAVTAMAKGLQAKGGLIREQCAARSVETTGGKVSAVVTEDGAVATDRVLCAGGVWSKLFLSNLGIALPQLAVKGTVVRTQPGPEIFGGAAALGDIFVRRRQDSGYTVASGLTEHTIGADSVRFAPKFIPSLASTSDIAFRLGRDGTQQGIMKNRWKADETSPFEQCRVLNPAPSTSGLKKIQSNLQQRAPAISNLAHVQSWAGMIDATPDVVPVMDRIDALPGLFLAIGFSGHGFGIGPGAGRVMAQLITGESPPFDLQRFRYTRFFDGSKIRPGPAI
ncbi:MAG: NAD(P)/FAD-dependent oxidoreductase [Lysobacterales bacterium]